MHEVVESELRDARYGRVSSVGKSPVSVKILVHLARGDVKEQRGDEAEKNAIGDGASKGDECHGEEGRDGLGEITNQTDTTHDARKQYPFDDAGSTGADPQFLCG